MTTITLTSELEAINTLLDAIGESAINSLSVSGLADVAKARAVLDEVSRDVQTTGWDFNTEPEYPLTRSTEGTISLPSNCLKASFAKTAPDLKLAQRGLRLYDKVKHTFAFDKDLTTTATFLLPWDDLPQVARHYIMVRAARIFQARTLGSDTQFKFSEGEEGFALSAMQESEGDTGGYNVFSSSFSVMSILER